MFSALLDACVLVPSLKRDVVLEIAERGVYRPLWSQRILAEVTTAIRRIRGRHGADPDVTETYIARLHAQMAVAFPDALVSQWERWEATIELPDPNDRHVVAAAFAGRADVIVTDNGSDFPLTQLPPPLFTQTADMFLLDAYDLSPDAVESAIERVAARSGRYGPPRDPHDIVAQLAAHGCGRFAEAISPRFTMG